MLYLVLENLRAFLINQDSANGSRDLRGLFPTSYLSGFLRTFQQRRGVSVPRFFGGISCSLGTGEYN